MLARGSLLVGKGSERHRQENQREPTEEQGAPARTAREGKGGAERESQKNRTARENKKEGGRGGKEEERGGYAPDTSAARGVGALHSPKQTDN